MLGIRNKLFCKLNISPIKKNIMKLSSGTIFGQCISIIMIPILTHLYGPAAFGDLAIIQSTVIIINTFSDLGLTNCLMISKNEEDMEKIYKVIIFSVSSVSILFSLLYLLISPLFKLVNVGGNVQFIALLMIVAIFTTKQIQVGSTWLNRKCAYNVLLWNPIISSSIYSIMSIVLELSGYETYGLLMAWVIAQFVTLLHIIRHIPKMKTRLSFDGFKGIMIEYRHFVIYQMPTNVVISIRYQLPVFLIKAFFNSTILGYYSMTIRILQVPISLVAGAIGTVFFKTISDMSRKGQEIGQFVYSNINKVMKIAVIPMFLAVSVGDIIIEFFLGSQWATTGVYLRILGIQNLFLFLVTACGGLSVVLKKQHIAFIINIFQSIGLIAAIILGKLLFDEILISLILSVAVYIVLNIIFFSIMFKAMQVSVRKYLKIVSLYFIVMIVLAEILRIFLYIFKLVGTI